MQAQAVNIAGADEYRMIYQNGAYREALVAGMLAFVNQSRGASGPRSTGIR